MAEEDIILRGELIYYAHALSERFKGLFVVPISDIHYGNPLFSESHLNKVLKFVKDTPNAVAVLNGDLCESTIKTSKGEIYHQVGSPQEQRDWVISKLMPIKKKILGMTIGNHEMRIWNDVGIDICKDISSALGVPYRPEGILLKISFGNGNNYTEGRAFTYWCYATHGYGGARTRSAKSVKVERTSTFIHADFYLMSHDHVVDAGPVIYLLPDPRTRRQKDEAGNETGFTVGRVQAHRKMLVKTNAYIKWGGYAEMGGFPPSDLACPIVKLNGEGKPNIKVEV